MDANARTRHHSRTWQPPTDVYETDDTVVVRVEVGGMREDDFSIELENRLLIIRGMRTDYAERRAFQQMEIRFGEFGVAVELPAAIVSDQIEADYKDGFLRVVLPKATPRVISNQEV